MTTMPPSTVVESLADVDYTEIKMPGFVLYDHPKDFPDNIVVRVWEMASATPTNIVWLAETLEEARAAMPQHYHRFLRAPDDDPVIIETYL